MMNDIVNDENQRPDPDELLRVMNREKEKAAKGKLKIFFGMCAGVGKTYEMLRSAHEVLRKGVDVVAGYVETHGRKETLQLLDGIPSIPRKHIFYRGTALEEMDLDAILERKPKLALVDELAHTNVPGSRHIKRYQDVEELLNNGIDVYTTLNVQHLESRADTVAQITGSIIRETVPDSIIELADEIEMIDLSADDLIKRFEEGKVYTPERSRQAVQKFFRKGNLTALREMALRVTAERVDRQVRDFMKTERISGAWKTRQRFAVGIAGTTQSAELIRWTRRIAYSMDASWIVVHVETTNPMPDQVRIQLEKNIKLAQELGAEIVSTTDDDIPRGLIRAARQQNATQILVGKSRRGAFWQNETLLDRLIKLSGDIDIYVVANKAHAEKKESISSFLIFNSTIIQYLSTIGIIILAALICFPLTSVIGYQTVGLILLFIIALLSLKFGMGPVLSAATLSAILWDYFFIPPMFTFHVGDSADVRMLTLYFIIALVTGILSSRLHARERIVRQREERTSALYALTRDLSIAKTQDEVVHFAVANIKKYFSADVVVFLGNPDGDINPEPHRESTFKAEAKEFSVAAWVYWNEKKAGKNTDTLPFAAATYFPLSGPRYPLGVIGVKIPETAPLDLEHETLLQNFISQISSTMEREFLNEMAKQSSIIAESERLYKTLFNSVSHELRTPIATIIGVSDALEDENTASVTSTRKDLLHEVHLAADRLNRLVENLLDMTRLESGLIKPKLDWCDLKDIVSVILRKLEHEISQHNVDVKIPDSYPLVKLDFGLIEQAMTNLIYNASVYTQNGSTITILSQVSDGFCEIQISDNGPGLPKESLERVFDKFYRVPGSQTGGTGLGLSIVKGFIEAHKGTIKVENVPTGGTRFIIRIPTEIQYTDEIQDAQ